MARLSFRDQIAYNQRASAWLVVGFVLFVAGFAAVIALIVLAEFSPRTAGRLDVTRALVIGLIAAAAALAIAWLSYFFGDRLVLSSTGARQIQHEQDRELFNVVEEVAIAGGVPVPKVYVIDDPSLNAFATGRDPQHAAVAITTGLRAKLTRDELQGVMAHEVAHVRNYDIRLMMLLAVLVGTVATLSELLWQSLRFGRWGRSSRRNFGSKGNGLILLVVIVVGVVLALFAPLMAQLIQLAVSRQREYLADATAVQLTRYPQGLANALRKLAGDPNDLRGATSGTAHLFISNPIRKFRDLGSSLFSSHPPLRERIRILEAMGGSAI